MEEDQGQGLDDGRAGTGEHCGLLGSQASGQRALLPGGQCSACLRGTLIAHG